MTDKEMWPEEIRLGKDKKVLEVKFNDGREYGFTAEYLRVSSPSAEVQGHSPAERQTVPGKRGVKIADIEQVGNYAIKIAFDDGHDTGLYSWTLLHDLGVNMDVLWARYVEELEDKGLSRD